MNTTILEPNTNNADNIQSALAAAGLDWRVSMRNIVTTDGIAIPNNFATVREDNNAVLGIVGSKYTIIQNQDALGIGDDYIAASGDPNVKYASAHAIDGGKRIFVTVDLNKSFEPVPGDPYESYLTFLTSHDGSSSTKIWISTLRGWCKNQLQASLAQGRQNNTLAGIRHTQSALDSLEMARFNLKVAGASIDNLKFQLRELADRKVTTRLVDKYLSSLMPLEAVKEGRGRTIIENKHNKIKELYELNDNNAVPSIRGTRYNLLNAVTEFVDHHENVRNGGGNADTVRQERAIFGTGSEFKQKALGLLMAMEA